MDFYFLKQFVCTMDNNRRWTLFPDYLKRLPDGSPDKEDTTRKLCTLLITTDQYISGIPISV